MGEPEQRPEHKAAAVPQLSGAGPAQPGTYARERVNYFNLVVLVLLLVPLLHLL